MRLRSSQFVFLLLLVCSAQIHGDCASQLLTGAMQAHAAAVSGARDEASAAVLPRHRHASGLVHSNACVPLGSASLAVSKTAWTMRRPAADSAAIISFTGFLRA